MRECTVRAFFRSRAKDNGQVSDISLFTFEGIEVAEGLGGVLVAAITRIDDGDGGVVCEGLSRALPRVTDYYDVHVAADHPGGVGEGFALGYGRRVDVNGGDDVPAKAVHGRFEGEAGAGAGFVEEAGHDHALTEIGLAADVGVHAVGEGEDGLDLVVGDVVDGDEVAAPELYSHFAPPATRSASLAGALPPRSATSSRSSSSSTRTLTV